MILILPSTLVCGIMEPLQLRSLRGVTFAQMSFAIGETAEGIGGALGQ